MSGLEMRYFVLRPGKGGPHGRASRHAMWAYAQAIRDEDPLLAAELLNWAHREEIAHGCKGDGDNP